MSHNPERALKTTSDHAGAGTPPAAADMAFVQYLIPPLESGDFTITVTQDVSVNGTSVDSFTNSQAFKVAGEHYSLAPADVDSVFPPMGNQGEFSNTLAHVVFTSPTLPWERSPLPQRPLPVAGAPVATWLAVLQLDQDDLLEEKLPPPSPHAVTVADLVATADIFFPPRLDEEEAPTDAVNVIDIPLALFNHIAPSLADLDWTAHVRAVDPVAKAATAVPPTDYSVVFGNRLPVAGNTSFAHLVSVEGYGPFLPAADGTPNPGIPAGTKFVRLVVLRSWTFTAFNLKQTFAGLLTDAKMSPSALQMPYKSVDASGNPAADKAVQDAFGLGFVAMDHALRDGSTTVSWYRGPLLPLGTPVVAAPSGSSADSWLRYDPSTGMFDISYASAWELGRLLALHDRAYATALFRWKLTQTQTQVANLEQQIIDQELSPIVPAPPSGAETGTPSAAELRHHRMAAVIKALAGPAAAALHGRAGGEQ